VVGCLVEEETPPAWYEERIMATTQLVNAPQLVAASEPETPNTQFLGRTSTTHLRNETGHGRSTSPLGYPQPSPGCFVQFSFRRACQA
jgi:hypothetical protein